MESFRWPSVKIICQMRKKDEALRARNDVEGQV